MNQCVKLALSKHIFYTEQNAFSNSADIIVKFEREFSLSCVSLH